MPNFQGLVFLLASQVKRNQINTEDTQEDELFVLPVSSAIHH